jgi:cob(I)alamin adenosyltransferase
MKIYTKSGDAGETSLYGGQRVSKADPRVEAYGTVDETNALLGVARASGAPEDVDALLEQIQNELFVVGGELACPPERVATLGLPLIDEPQTQNLEQAIDRFEAELEPLRSFVLPAGSSTSSALHHARAVCRRAERLVVELAHSSEVRPALIVYLNRLSDLLFVMARYANHRAKVPDVLWAPRKRSAEGA